MKLLRRLLFVALVGGLLLAGVRFAEQNAQLVSVDYPFGGVLDAKLWVLLLWTFGAGAVLAGVLCAYEMVRLGLLSRRYRKLAGRLEAEIHQLRNLPLSDEAPVPPSSSAGRDPVSTLPGGLAERGA